MSDSHVHGAGVVREEDLIAQIEAEQVLLRRFKLEGPAAFLKEIRRLRSAISEASSGEDQAYLERAYVVAALARLYPSGTRRTDIPGWKPNWHGCVYIDLPAGQISFHYEDSQAPLFAALPAYTRPYDGHSKADVFIRLGLLDGAYAMDVRAACCDALDYMESLATHWGQAKADSTERHLLNLAWAALAKLSTEDRAETRSAVGDMGKRESIAAAPNALSQTPGQTGASTTSEFTGYRDGRQWWRGLVWEDGRGWIEPAPAPGATDTPRTLDIPPPWICECGGHIAGQLTACCFCQRTRNSSLPVQEK
jgi:hypothetical protein